jgi:hypothetical protein
VLVAGCVARRRQRTTLVAAVGLLALNQRFYLLLLRQRGWREATAGVPLHVLHHLVSVAAVPAGIAFHLKKSFSRRSAGTTSSDHTT